MHSFNSVLIHCVWSTKNREPVLKADLRDRLWSYLGGIAKKNKIKALAISGTSDHGHMLISLPPTLSVAKAVQLLKGNSSKWIHETFPTMVHSESNRASSNPLISRRIRDDAPQTWLRLR
jgi:putative transposase